MFNLNRFSIVRVEQARVAADAREQPVTVPRFAVESVMSRVRPDAFCGRFGDTSFAVQIREIAIDAKRSMNNES
jgi:hypothetical protein